MKRFAAWILLAVLLLGLAGCAEEISREAIDRRYIAPYDGVETDYVYKYDMWKGEFVMVPEIRTVHHNAKYQILYRITYDNGSTDERWVDVGEATYNAFES